MTTDPFAVLGVSPDATLDEVRTARRKLAAEFHPDHGGDPVRMGEINIAFDAVVAEITVGPGSPPPPASPAPAQPSEGIDTRGSNTMRRLSLSIPCRPRRSRPC